MKILPTYFKKWGGLFFGAGIVLFSFPVPKVHAMDPITIGLLAPILMPYAQKAASPILKGLNPQQLQEVISYGAKGCTRTVPGWINAGTQVLNIFRLPLGALQLTAGAPFGLMSYGVENMWTGGVAPFMMTKEILCMPLYFFGAM